MSSRATIKINEKTEMIRSKDEDSIVKRVETPGDPLGVSNTTEALVHTKSNSWTPMGKETEKQTSYNQPNI